MEMSKLVVTLVAALILGIVALAFLLVFSFISLPFYLVALVFAGLVALIFGILQIAYVLYAITEQIIFPKKEGKAKHKEYTIEQSKESK